MSQARSVCSTSQHKGDVALGILATHRRQRWYSFEQTQTVASCHTVLCLIRPPRTPIAFSAARRSCSPSGETIGPAISGSSSACRSPSPAAGPPSQRVRYAASGMSRRFSTPRSNVHARDTAPTRDTDFPHPASHRRPILLGFGGCTRRVMAPPFTTCRKGGILEGSLTHHFGVKI
jgi:hypothetical protein